MVDKKDELYSDKYKTSDFHWGISLGEGKYINSTFTIIFLFNYSLIIEMI